MDRATVRHQYTFKTLLHFFHTLLLDFHIVTQGVNVNNGEETGVKLVRTVGVRCAIADRVLPL